MRYRRGARLGKDCSCAGPNRVADLLDNQLAMAERYLDPGLVEGHLAHLDHTGGDQTTTSGDG